MRKTPGRKFTQRWNTFGEFSAKPEALDKWALINVTNIQKQTLHRIEEHALAKKWRMRIRQRLKLIIGYTRPNVGFRNWQIVN